VQASCARLPLNDVNCSGGHADYDPKEDQLNAAAPMKQRYGVDPRFHPPPWMRSRRRSCRVATTSTSTAFHRQA
jgi:hypothetical protein